MGNRSHLKEPNGGAEGSQVLTFDVHRQLVESPGHVNCGEISAPFEGVEDFFCGRNGPTRLDGLIVQLSVVDYQSEFTILLRDQHSWCAIWAMLWCNQVFFQEGIKFFSEIFFIMKWHPSVWQFNRPGAGIYVDLV